MVRQGLQHLKPGGQGCAGHTALEPAQRARDAAVRRQNAGIVVGAAKIAAFRRQPVAVARRFAVNRRAPAILEAAAQQVLGFSIAAAGRAEKTGKGGAPVAGQAVACQKHPSQLQLGLDQTASGCGFQPVGGVIPAQSLAEFRAGHRA